MARRTNRTPKRLAREPEVIVDFEYSAGLLFVSIENLADAPAYDVSVGFDRKVVGVDGRELSSLNVFRNLAFLPPKKKIRAFVDSLQSYVARRQPMVVKTTVRYQGKDGRRLFDKTKHDLSVYEDLPEVW